MLFVSPVVKWCALLFCVSRELIEMLALSRSQKLPPPGEDTQVPCDLRPETQSLLTLRNVCDARQISSTLFITLTLFKTFLWSGADLWHIKWLSCWEQVWHFTKIRHLIRNGFTPVKHTEHVARYKVINMYSSQNNNKDCFCSQLYWGYFTRRAYKIETYVKYPRLSKLNSSLQAQWVPRTNLRCI